MVFSLAVVMYSVLASFCGRWQRLPHNHIKYVPYAYANTYENFLPTLYDCSIQTGFIKRSSIALCYRWWRYGTSGKLSREIVQFDVSNVAASAIGTSHIHADRFNATRRCIANFPIIIVLSFARRTGITAIAAT